MMARCEDYPCCGHGPSPMGDGGGCPDAQGRFKCVECGRRMPKSATSAICAKCHRKSSSQSEEDREYAEMMQSDYDERWRS